MKAVTDDEILGIALLDDFNESHSQIAQKFGIASRTVGNILCMRRQGRPRAGKGDISTGSKRAGLATAGSNGILERKDLAEVAAYMKANPGCSTNDIAMCCHMGQEQARRLRKLVAGQA